MLWLPVGTETVAIDVCYTGSVFPWESILPGIRMYVRTPLAMLCVYCISVMYVRTKVHIYVPLLWVLAVLGICVNCWICMYCVVFVLEQLVCLVCV